MLNPQIELEKMLSTQIHDALHGGIIRKILDQSSVDQGGDYWKNTMAIASRLRNVL